MEDTKTQDQANRVLMRKVPRELSKAELEIVSGGDRWGDYQTVYDTGAACDAD